jgi:hypothetical protein
MIDTANALKKTILFIQYFKINGYYDFRKFWFCIEILKKNWNGSKGLYSLAAAHDVNSSNLMHRWHLDLKLNAERSLITFFSF